MKRLLPAVAAALLATSAHAMHLDPGGNGQALWFPYYTVNGGHDTYFTIGSTSWRGTVAKVRFLDARHGRPVLDFNVYLAPFDSWTAVIYQTSPDAPPMLRTTDRSCTTPAIPAEGVRFRTNGFDGTGPFPADDAPRDIGRTREGAIEVIAGGSILEGTPTAAAITPTTAGAPPPGCASLPGSMVSDIWTPTNDLSGSAAIIDVADGEYYAYNADAIAYFTDLPLMSAADDPLRPSLAQGNTPAYYFADGAAAGNGSTPRTANPQNAIDNVTALFVSDTISNDYLVSAALGAKTDWIISYPTRRFYSDPVYAAFAGVDYVVENGVLHVDVFDREGAGTDPQALATNIVLKYDTVNVLTIAHDPADAGLFDSQFSEHLLVGPDSGVVRLRTSMPGSPGLGVGVGGIGLMYGTGISGFMAYNIVNANALPGRLSNYGATFPHHLTKCDGPSMFPAACRRWSDHPR